MGGCRWDHGACFDELVPTESHHLPKVRNFTAYHVPNIMYQSKYATGKAQKAGGWIWHHKHWFGTQVEYGCRVSHALYSAQTYFQYASILPAKYIALPHLLFVELFFLFNSSITSKCWWDHRTVQWWWGELPPPKSRGILGGTQSHYHQKTFEILLHDVQCNLFVKLLLRKDLVVLLPWSYPMLGQVCPEESVFTTMWNNSAFCVTCPSLSICR